jgi:hypothetical protein
VQKITVQTKLHPSWVAVALIALGSTAFGASSTQAQMYEVTITNLTQGQILSPPIVVSHRSGFEVFQPGEPASPELAAVAEDAESEPLLAWLSTRGAVADVSIAADVVPPGSSITVPIQIKGNRRNLTVLGMLVTTNDAFFSNTSRVRSQKVEFYAPAWDAGSERNTQNCAHIPGPPCGHPGVRVTDGAEGFVHIHEGIQNRSSLQSQDFDWRNPVAKISVRRR